MLSEADGTLPAGMSASPVLAAIFRDGSDAWNGREMHPPPV